MSNCHLHKAYNRHTVHSHCAVVCEAAVLYSLVHVHVHVASLPLPRRVRVAKVKKGKCKVTGAGVLLA